MNLLLLFLWFQTTTVKATPKMSTPIPRAVKKGEERTPFTRAGAKCGTLAQIDNRWYFYVESPKEMSNAVSPGFETRKEAAKWAKSICPQQGKVVVAK